MKTNRDMRRERVGVEVTLFPWLQGRRLGQYRLACSLWYCPSGQVYGFRRTALPSGDSFQTEVWFGVWGRLFLLSPSFPPYLPNREQGDGLTLLLPLLSKLPSEPGARGRLDPPPSSCHIFWRGCPPKAFWRGLTDGSSSIYLPHYIIT